MKRQRNGSIEVIPTSSELFPSSPMAAGLWFVMTPTGRMLATVEGYTPFLSVRLIDPWDPTARSYAPAPAALAELVWEREIQQPETRS